MLGQRLVKEGFTKEVTFEKAPEGGEGGGDLAF